MIKSLRWRLQIWYTGLLLAIVGGYGSIVYYQAQVSKFQEIDRQLEASALYLDATLRGLPLYLLDGKDPPWPKEKKGGPPPKGRDRLLADIALPRELEGPAGLPDAEKPYFAVWRADGSLLKATPLPTESPRHDMDDATPPRPHIEERGDYREAWMRGPRKTQIVVGRTVAKELTDLHAFAWQLIGFGAAVLLVGMAGGFWVAARIFRPISAMSAAAEAMNASNLSARIATSAVDVELAGLAEVLNSMFARLEAAFARQQQFTADASHELRTPLAILRANAELALAQSRSPEEYRHTIETCLRAGNRMSALVGGLLQLARADAGHPGMRWQEVRFDEVVTDCLTLVKPLAEEKRITLTADLSPAAITGDADSLAQLVDNLLSNAIQHNRPDGNVHVKLAATKSGAVLTVADTGIGIPEKDQPQIFERFFRVDKARARASGGTGLGLAICKSIVEAHGGTIAFESHENVGTTFRVELPSIEI
jgi:two-component system, OmpR family, sensor kinase